MISGMAHRWSRFITLTGFGIIGCGSHPDPFHFVEADIVASAIVEVRRPRAGMVGHGGGVLKRRRMWRRRRHADAAHCGRSSARRRARTRRNATDRAEKWPHASGWRLSARPRVPANERLHDRSRMLGGPWRDDRPVSLRRRIRAGYGRACRRRYPAFTAGRTRITTSPRVVSRSWITPTTSQAATWPASGSSPLPIATGTVRNV